MAIPPHHRSGAPAPEAAGIACVCGGTGSMAMFGTGMGAILATVTPSSFGTTVLRDGGGGGGVDRRAWTGAGAVSTRSSSASSRIDGSRSRITGGASAYEGAGATSITTGIATIGATVGTSATVTGATGFAALVGGADLRTEGRGTGGLLLGALMTTDTSNDRSGAAHGPWRIHAREILRGSRGAGRLSGRWSARQRGSRRRHLMATGSWQPLRPRAGIFYFPLAAETDRRHAQARSRHREGPARRPSS